MKKILSVAYYEIVKNIRDVKMLLILVISPIVLIFILGKSLDSFLTLEYIPKPIMGYVNIDNGNLSESFDTFLNRDEIKDLMVIKRYETKDEALKAIEHDEINCLVFIDYNFSGNISQNKETMIEISGRKDTWFVETIVNNYVNTYNLNTSIIKSGHIPIENHVPVKIERGKLNSDNVYPTSMDYYAVQTLLQILLLCGVVGVSIIIRDYKDGLLVRVKSLPVKKCQLIIGRLIGSIMYSFIAAIITILFSKFVYQANWNGNPLLIASAIFLFVIIAIGIGVLLGTLTKNYISSFGILAIFVILFPASVGAFSPKTTVKAISVFAPNHYAKNIIFGTIYDYPKEMILSGFIGLFIMIIIIYGLIIFFEGRRKYENI
ncbi:ABC transporter permease [Mycoplasmatota bacterium]|nr:ABC transporter permease [Mycoplasmatota bacterium]